MWKSMFHPGYIPEGIFHPVDPTSFSLLFHPIEPLGMGEYTLNQRHGSAMILEVHVACEAVPYSFASIAKAAGGQ